MSLSRFGYTGLFGRFGVFWIPWVACQFNEVAKVNEPDSDGTRDSLKPPSVSKVGRHLPWNARTCPVCGVPLSVNEQARGKTCPLPRCKGEYLRGQLQRQSEESHHVQLKAEQYRDSVCQNNLLQAGKTDVCVLPANIQRLNSLPEKRIRLFRDRLIGVISGAMAARYGKSRVSNQEADGEYGNEVSTTDDPAIVGYACATCRGECCSQGGDHAFLQHEVIARYMDAFPRQRPIEILATFMSYLPRKTYQESCVYHGATGCGLPREMRASLCNDFQCNGLKKMCAQIRFCEEPEVFAVAVNGTEIVRGAAISSTDRTGAGEIPGAGNL